MAVAQDNSGKGISTNQAAGVAFTFSYTVNSNTNGIIVISVYTGDRNGTNHQYPSAVSYGGVACTVVTSSKVTSSGLGTSSIWYLVAPASGSNTVSVTVPTTGSGDGSSRVVVFVDSFTGADQLGQVDSGVTNTASASTTLSLTTTTIVDNSWGIGIFVSNQAAAPTASSGVTIRQSDTTAGNGSAMGDSNAALTPVGSKTMTATGTSGNWIGSMITIKPYTGKAFQVDSGGTLTNNLVAYYKLEDATDFYSSNNLTNTGSCAFNAAKVNNGVDSGASPSGKYLSISSDLGITGGAISVSCWAKHTAAYGANVQQALFYQADSSTFVGYMAIFGTDGASAGRVGFCRVRQGIAEDFLYSSQTINTSTFYHLVLTYDGTTLKGYFNGSEVVSSARSGSGSSNASDLFELMKQTDNGGLYQFEGLVDEVGVWNRALTTTEITDLYNAGAGQTMSNDYSVNVSDTVSITESVTVTNTSLGDVSVSDSVTITESVSLDFPLDISVSDSIAVSESVSITNGLADINVFDAVTITESITMSISQSRRGMSIMRSNEQSYPVALGKSKVDHMRRGEQSHPLPLDDTRIL